MSILFLLSAHKSGFKELSDLNVEGVEGTGLGRAEEWAQAILRQTGTDEGGDREPHSWETSQGQGFLSRVTLH